MKLILVALVLAVGLVGLGMRAAEPSKTLATPVLQDTETPTPEPSPTSTATPEATATATPEATDTATPEATVTETPDPAVAALPALGGEPSASNGTAPVLVVLMGCVMAILAFGGLLLRRRLRNP